MNDRDRLKRTRNVRRIAALVTALVLAVPFAVSASGCSKGGGAGAGITAKDIQGDPSKMPAEARQAMQNAQGSGARQGAAAQSSGGAPKAPAATK